MSLNLLQKTALLGCTVIAIVIGGLLLVFQANGEITAAVRQLTDDIPVQITESEHFNANLNMILTHAKIFAYSGDQAELALIEHQRREARAALVALEQLLLEDDIFDADIAKKRALLARQRTELLDTAERVIDDLVKASAQDDRSAVARVLGQIDALMNLAHELEGTSDQIAAQGLAGTAENARSHVRQGNHSVLTILGALVLVQIFSLVGAWRGITQPITKLAHAVTLMAHDHQYITVAITNRDEIGVLQRSFNQTSKTLVAAREQVAEQQRLLEQRVAERTAELRATLDHLRDAHAAEAELRSTISDLASPLVPVLEGILVMPLIGGIDAARAQTIMTTLLRGIEQQQARVVLLDVTGVPIIDTQVARSLLQSASAARLLGAQVMLVGLRPELAQTIVGLGINLAGISTYADLQSGVRAALGSSGKF